ncbi:ribonuclease H-like domain-containing protein, partial [Tanacetum coccineum]
NSEMEADPAQDYFALRICSSYTSTVKSSESKNEGEKPNKDAGLKTNEEPEFAQDAEDLLPQAGAARATSTNTVNTIRTPISSASPLNVFSAGGPALNNNDQDDSQIPALEDIYDSPSNGNFTNASYDDEGAVADFTNLESTVNQRRNNHNVVSTSYGVSTSSGYNSQRENSSSYTDELMYSFFANQSSGPQLDHKDLEQLDEFDLEEMDLKWQVAMISMRLKKFYKKTSRRLQFNAKEPVGFDKTKVECFNCHNTGHFARERPGKYEEPKALVTLDGEGVDWTGHAEDEQENFALMAYSNSGSDTE